MIGRRLSPYDLRHELPRGPSTWSSRLKNATTFVLAFWGIWLLQQSLWRTPRVPMWLGGHLWVWLGVVWCLPLPIALFMIGGFFSYRRPETEIRVSDIPVAFRFVSRGENAEVLKKAIESVHRCMRRNHLFPYVIEVVTDSATIDLSQHDVEHLVVPVGYKTPKGSLYKARALHYAVTHSRIPDQCWIMHCDEESHATPSLVSGIAQAILEEERSGRHRIGQGIVLYHNEREDHPLMTMADMTRTGDDVARFAFQCRALGIAVFGFHGSFILVRNSVAKEVGYDFGPKGSVTEDAFWALAQMDRGRRCRFVDGYMVEQAPQSVADFLKQRRRWFLGLFETILHAPARLRYRLPLAICVGIWSLSWLTVFYTALNLLIGYKTPLPIRLSGNVVFAAFVSTYLVGMRLNLEDANPGPLRSLAWTLGQLVAIPLCSIWESLGVVYGFLKPELGFHVIAKNPRGSEAPQPQPALARAVAVMSGPSAMPRQLAPRPTAASAGAPHRGHHWASSTADRLREELAHLEGALVPSLDLSEAVAQHARSRALGSPAQA